MAEGRSDADRKRLFEAIFQIRFASIRLESAEDFKKLSEPMSRETMQLLDGLTYDEVIALASQSDVQLEVVDDAT